MIYRADGNIAFNPHPSPYGMRIPYTSILVTTPYYYITVTIRGTGTMVCMSGDQPININLVVKVGGHQYIVGPPRF